jgi:hypothetical protein
MTRTAPGTAAARLRDVSRSEHDRTVEALSERELERELTIAAMATGRARWERYAALLAERARRTAAA